MILAAGRGERLRPFTERYPKALCKVHDIPLIEYHVINLAKAGFTKIIINHAYLGGKIRQHLQNGQRFGVNIYYSPEPPGAFETGGGIVNAISLLGHDPFITINADIYTDYDYSSLKLPSTSLGHVVLVNNPTDRLMGDFGLSATQQVHNEDRKYTFSGIACYHPDMFKDCKPGRYSITPLLRETVKNQMVTGEIYSGTWFDIGTLERLKIAEERT